MFLLLYAAIISGSAVSSFFCPVSAGGSGGVDIAGGNDDIFSRGMSLVNPNYPLRDEVRCMDTEAEQSEAEMDRELTRARSDRSKLHAHLDTPIAGSLTS